MSSLRNAMARLVSIALLVCVAIAGSSCGDSETTTPDPVRAPVELELRTSTGATIDLGDYRGSLVLLALLGTYDTNSQASLESLSRFARHHEDVFVVAILAQQGAELLVDPFASAANVPFPVAYSVDGSLLEGTSALGRVEAVPNFIALDATGIATARHDGFASERALEQLVELARAAAPLPDRSSVPLLGQPR